MSSTGPTEGLLYVAARIKSPPLVSLELFRKWYDEVHIPDLCNAKDGVTIALRYKHTSPKAHIGGEANDDVPWPFLTIYKLHDIHWLTTDGFLNVRHDSELLPAEAGHNAFGCFDAQLRSYKLIARSPEQPGTDRPKFVLTFETPAPNPEKFGMMTKVYSALPGYRGSILYEIVPGLLEHEQKDVANMGYVVTWFDEIPKLDGPRHDAQIWELVHCDGKKDATF